MFNTNGSVRTDITMNYPLPKIKIGLTALYKMETYTANCNTEIGWQGFAVFNRQTNEIFIDDVFLPEQQANGSTCELLPSSQSAIISELARNPATATRINQIRVWGHSHVNMGTGPSSQDELQLRSFVSPERCTFFIGIITNKKKDLSCYYVDPYVYARFVPWEIFNPDAFNEQLVIEEIKAKVKAMTPPEKKEQMTIWSGGKELIVSKETFDKKFNSEKKKSVKDSKATTLQEVIENIDRISTQETVDFDELLAYIDQHADNREATILQDSLYRLEEIVAEIFYAPDFSYATESDFLMDIAKLLSMSEFGKERNKVMNDISLAWGDEVLIEEADLNVFIDQICCHDEFLTLFNYVMITVARYYNTTPPSATEKSKDLKVQYAKEKVIKGDNIKKSKEKKKGEKKGGLLKTKRSI